MSCRETSGGSAVLSVARARSGLPIARLQSLFHELRREGRDLPTPKDAAIDRWRGHIRALVSKLDIPEQQRESLERRLFRSISEETPDGAMFYAWSRLDARALQEVAINSPTVPVVDLAPPGSQRDQYELGPDGRPSTVYYASYGSNLFAARFAAYIEGGTVPGNTRIYTGARDTTSPQDDIPIRFAARPMFAMESGTWGGGGVAFVDPGGEGTSLGRAYLITSEQFDDVVAQENGITVGTLRTPLADATGTAGSAQVDGNAMYGRLVHIGDHNGRPVLTFTGAFTTHDALVGGPTVPTRTGRQHVKENIPSPAYVRVIGAGLKETFGISITRQADYIRGCPGGDQWSRRDLVRILKGVKMPVEIEAEKRAAERARAEAKRAERERADRDRRGGTRRKSAWYEEVEDDLASRRGRTPSSSSSSNMGSVRVRMERCRYCGEKDWCNESGLCVDCRLRSRGTQGAVTPPRSTSSSSVSSASRPAVAPQRSARSGSGSSRPTTGASKPAPAMQPTRTDVAPQDTLMATYRAIPNLSGWYLTLDRRTLAITLTDSSSKVYPLARVHDVVENPATKPDVRAMFTTVLDEAHDLLESALDANDEEYE